MTIPDPVGERAVTCPTCATVIDPRQRCGTMRGGLRCMAMSGHPGWHWADMGSGKVLRWTGVTASVGCYGRLGDLESWCVKEAGHDGAHNNGRGVSFSDPEPIQEAS